MVYSFLSHRPLKGIIKITEFFEKNLKSSVSSPGM